jgi:hypothetical protein
MSALPRDSESTVMNDESDEARKRREDVARLRAAAGSTTPEAYKVSAPRTTANPMVGAGDSYNTLFGAYFAGSTGWRQHVATAFQLGAYGMAYIVLILMLNVAQCEWWYEPGMYSNGSETERVGGR